MSGVFGFSREAVRVKVRVMKHNINYYYYITYLFLRNVKAHCLQSLENLVSILR